MGYKVRPESTDPAAVEVAVVTVDGRRLQAVLVSELPEVPVDPTGGLVRYSVDADPAVTLDPPTAAVTYCRLRVYHSAQNAVFRLYYRQDNVAPLADGTNAAGYLLHGEAFVVRISNLANFKMIGETAMTGTFEVYAEWLKQLSS